MTRTAHSQLSLNYLINNPDTARTDEEKLVVLFTQRLADSDLSNNNIADLWMILTEIREMVKDANTQNTKYILYHIEPNCKFIEYTQRSQDNAAKKSYIDISLNFGSLSPVTYLFFIGQFINFPATAVYRASFPQMYKFDDYKDRRLIDCFGMSAFNNNDGMSGSVMITLN
jgi:hypothetical protein